ncbi:MAG: glycerophosphodiester phosphodiesterase [Acidimicrobiia bacterium]|nr:glycerophosphodiester phosphodiesterase [Acidimicrobiia bacterium]
MRTPIGPGPLIYGHRGDSAHAPDNSLEAFALAVAAGADGIELDVRKTRDDVLVLSHDPVHPDAGRIDRVAAADLFARDPAVTTLDLALDAIPPEVFVNVEIKNHRHEPGFDRTRSIAVDTVTTIRRHGAESRVLFTSFDAPTMTAVSATGTTAMRGLLVARRMPVRMGIALAARAGHHTINVDRRLLDPAPERVVETASDRNLVVNAWTVDDPQVMRTLFDAGVVAVITNDPAVGRATVDAM